MFYPNLNFILDNEPSVFEISYCDIIYHNIDALHNAKQNYIAVDSCEKIWRVFRHNVCALMQILYIIIVIKFYYQTKNFKGWKCPAVILEKDGQFELDYHGGDFYCVYQCQLLKVKDMSN